MAFPRTPTEGTQTLYDLHWEIQCAFDWDNDHLDSFYMRDDLEDLHCEYAPDPIGEDVDWSWVRAPRSAANMELWTLGLEHEMQFKYLFDSSSPKGNLGSAAN